MLCLYIGGDDQHVALYIPAGEEEEKNGRTVKSLVVYSIGSLSSTAGDGSIRKEAREGI